MSETPEEPTYDLVMPFVTVRSRGGMHDDASYAAGWEMAQMDYSLQSDPDNWPGIISKENHAQADLIAMRHGYQLTVVEDNGHHLAVELKR